MPVERGDSGSPVGGTSTDVPSTFEQSTLKGTTSTGNARLIVRDATQIQVIDTNNVWTSLTVEGVLDEIAGLTGLDSGIQDQIDALVAVDVTHTADILTNANAITALAIRVTDNEGDIITNATAIGTETTNRIAADAVVAANAEALSIAYAIALGG